MAINSSRSWRQDAIEKYDELRLSTIELKSKKSSLVLRNRDEFLKNEEKVKVGDLLESLKEASLHAEEQVIVYQAFLDAVAQDKLKMNNSYVSLTDLEKILLNMIGFIRTNFNVPETNDDDDDLDPFVAEVLKSLKVSNRKYDKGFSLIIKIFLFNSFF